MRTYEITNFDRLHKYLDRHYPACCGVVFRDLKLWDYDDALRGADFCDKTIFIGCELGDQVAQAAIRKGCLILPPQQDLGYNPFRGSLYTYKALYNAYDLSNPSDSYWQCVDWLAYKQCMDPETRRRRRTTEFTEELLFRLHDFFQEDALKHYLEESQAKVVAIMGGHSMKRRELDKGEDSDYMRTALLAWKLSKAGFVIATGGGPGAMEAGNLGAYFKNADESTLRAAVRKMSEEPKAEMVSATDLRWDSGKWLRPAIELLHACELDAHFVPGDSLGIPTWFYGHEPPNPFATKIAKYFENSLREEGLLAIATHGVIFTPGNGGTVQEIFQDGCQNYYSTYGNTAPMVMFDSAYWNPTIPIEDREDRKPKPAWPLLQKIAKDSGIPEFSQRLLLSDDIDEVVTNLTKF